MPRYFIEVAYKGGGYAGFQVQQNANTIQAEVEKALNIYFRFPTSSHGVNPHSNVINHEGVISPSPLVERVGVRETGVNPQSNILNPEGVTSPSPPVEREGVRGPSPPVENSGVSASGVKPHSNVINHEGVISPSPPVERAGVRDSPSPPVEREGVRLTGSSRTDTGVHAKQNYFHFDTVKYISPEEANKGVYHLNAILPGDIVILSIRQVKENAHCRFDALSRTYKYTVYTLKDPFIADMAYYYPYSLNINALQDTAALIKEYTEFQSFSKKNSQVLSFDCRISRSEWEVGENRLVYTVTGNRFLRGMVRGLVGTMLQAGRGKHSIETFRQLIESRNAAGTDFSVPGKGLILESVQYPDDIFELPAGV
ncbi:MAG: tRNA pseudouridine synthase A [Ferruginibacter sp.]